MANDISMVGEEGGGVGPSCSPRTRTISLPDQPGRYSACVATFTGVCHLVCGIACLVLRTEVYSRIQYSLHTYEVVFLLVLSIIATLACNINNFVVTFMISILTDIEYTKLFRAYRRDYYKLEDHMPFSIITFINLFAFVEAIASLIGFFNGVRSLFFGRINTVVVKVSEGEKIKLSDDVQLA